MLLSIELLNTYWCYCRSSLVPSWELRRIPRRMPRPPQRPPRRRREEVARPRRRSGPRERPGITKILDQFCVTPPLGLTHSWPLTCLDSYPIQGQVEQLGSVWQGHLWQAVQGGSHLQAHHSLYCVGKVEGQCPQIFNNCRTLWCQYYLHYMTWRWFQYKWIPEDYNSHKNDVNFGSIQWVNTSRCAAHWQGVPCRSWRAKT